MDWSMASCSATISFSLSVRKREACSIMPIIFSFSSLAMTFCSLSEYCRTNSLGEAWISQLAVLVFLRYSSLGQQQLPMRAMSYLFRLTTKSSGFWRVSLMQMRPRQRLNSYPAAFTSLFFFQVLSISTMRRNSQLSQGTHRLTKLKVSIEDELQSMMKPTYSAGSILLGSVMTSNTAMKVSLIIRWVIRSLARLSLTSFCKNSTSWLVLSEGWWQTPMRSSNYWLLFITITPLLFIKKHKRPINPHREQRDKWRRDYLRGKSLSSEG